MPLKEKWRGSGRMSMVPLESALDFACMSKRTLKRDESQQMFSWIE